MILQQGIDVLTSGTVMKPKAFKWPDELEDVIHDYHAKFNLISIQNKFMSAPKINDDQNKIKRLITAVENSNVAMLQPTGG